jgi:hypothetical protein
MKHDNAYDDTLPEHSLDPHTPQAEHAPLSAYAKRLLLLSFLLIALINFGWSSFTAQRAFAAKTNVQGYWEYKGLLGMEFQVAFRSDGTTSDHPLGLWGHDASYEVIGDRIYVTNFWGVHTYTLEVIGDVMTFTEDDGDVLLFHRLGGWHH